MDIILVPLFKLIDSLLGLVFFAVISATVLEWLFSWGILNLSNQTACRIYDFLRRIVTPMFDFVGRYIPLIGGFDISPFVIMFAISFTRNVLSMLLVKLLG